MLNGLIIDDEEFRERLLRYYDKHDIVELLGLSLEDILDMFWDKVQDNPSIFTEVLTDLDHEEIE